MPRTIRMGVIGCGAISGAYLGMAKNFPVVQVHGVADLDPEKAKAAAEKFGVPNVYTVEQLLADKSIELVLNLTVPKAHVPVSMACLQAGKHVYLEKPLGVNRAEGQKLVDAAKKANLRIGCAPDTFLGAGIQTARKVVESGLIGKPLAVTAFMMGRGHESWHPSPEFYYEEGGGPMMDMGPYYLTALLNLFGPMKRLSGSATIAIPERTITSKPKFGKKITVETPDHYCGTMEFNNGVVGTIIMTFATRFSAFGGAQPITVFGEEGTLKVPDPNGFDGKVSVRLKDDKEDQFRDLPHEFVTGYGRSVGAADMAYAISSGRAHRCSLEQAFAVLDLMQGFRDSSESGRHYVPAAGYQRPAPMPAQLPFGQLDE